MFPEQCAASAEIYTGIFARIGIVVSGNCASRKTQKTGCSQQRGKISSHMFRGMN